MENIKDTVYKIFAGINTSYLIKTYFFAIILTFIAIAGSVDGDAPAFMYIYIIICGLLFPFATVLWDDFMTTIMGGNIILLPLPVMLVWKLMKLLILFIFTPFIAPIGFIYVYIANGYHKSN